MEFSKRMHHFETGVFSALSQMKQDRIAKGESVVDFSIGSPNIPPARHVIDALARGVEDRCSYEYAITDSEELLDAVCVWYRRRYGVELEHSEITSLLGSQDGLAHL